jgi:hypothetical protein
VYKDQAAKLIFKHPKSARDFYDFANYFEGYWIHGQKIKVFYYGQGTKPVLGCTRHEFFLSKVRRIPG